MNKILIVDDDPDIRSLYRLVLRREGLEVIEAKNGGEALSVINAERPSLVLLDIMMPGIDGYEVCRRLRSNPQTADLPVLLFSAKGTNADRRNGKRAGADDFVAKSVGPRAVVTRIQELLISARPSSGASIAPAPCA